MIAEKLFDLLEISDDGFKIAIIDCVRAVPLDSLQDQAVRFLVELVASYENLAVGRVEELIASIMTLFTEFAAVSLSSS